MTNDAPRTCQQCPSPQVAAKGLCTRCYARVRRDTERAPVRRRRVRELVFHFGLSGAARRLGADRSDVIRWCGDDGRGGDGIVPGDVARRTSKELYLVERAASRRRAGLEQAVFCDADLPTLDQLAGTHRRAG